jgi:hypothetical protein
MLSNNKITIPDVISVYQVATPQEKEELKNILLGKIQNVDALEKLSPDTTKRLNEIFQTPKRVQ